MDLAVKAGAAAVVVALALLAMSIVVLAGGAGGVPAAGAVSGCVPTGLVTGLSAEQSQNAEIIVGAANALGMGDPGSEIGVMTALTESGLTNVPPGAGLGGAIGLFQQTPGGAWGTEAAEEDPTQATGMFLQALLQVPNWQTIPPWQAAQAVQHSGAGASTDGAANYEQSWPDAQTVVAAVDVLATTTADCGGEATVSLPVGPPQDFGLPAKYVIPSGATPGEASAVAFAIAQLGKPYVWGAAGPAAFDCSGLTMAAWGTAGVSLDHYTGDQINEGTAVPDESAAAPGDLVLVPGSDGTLADPGHVGIYLGYGLVESAVDEQLGILVQSWSSFVAGGLSGIRHVG